MPIEMDGSKRREQIIMDEHGNVTEIHEDGLTFCEGGCDADNFVAAHVALNLPTYNPDTGRWNAMLANPEIWEE